MKATFITLLFALSLPLGLFAAEDYADRTLVLAQMSSMPKGTPWKWGVISELAGNFGISCWTLIAQMVNFCIVALVLYKFAVKPIAATLDERQQKIADGLQYAAK